MFLITKFIQVKTNNFIMVILFFIISIISLFLIYNDTMIINHTGLFLFIVNNAFFLNVFFNDNDNVNTSILITTGIFIILTLITTFLSNETLIKLQKLLPPFMILLCLVIIIQIVLIMCCSNTKYFKYFTRGATLLSVITIFIFIVFTLIDTSQVLLVNIAGTHYDQNYPKLSIQLILDYINLLLNIDNITK
ncbi:hypothetical protein Hokovirus_1_200 [Hokovirus HKV1]|uniref:Uncharacterized protein n=1 Tax=Hokovirus HKV1 TaxID=1977638 RepID=A0A1V0SF65_9VIRU|nr:hypothetical protein Hokovirus_1_200 [Hokovirus HKV1]